MQPSLNAVTGPPNPIKENMHKIHDLYTDYTLVCQGQEFKVHRVVLHLQSNIFAASFSGPFKEGQDSTERTLEIRDREPEVVQAMLDYFYTFSYEPPEGVSKLVFHLNVYALADYYCAADLMKASLRHFEIECEGKGWTINDLVLATRFLEDDAKGGMSGRERCRNTLVGTIRANLARLLDDGAFKAMLSEYVELNVELLRVMDVQVATQTAQPVQAAPGTGNQQSQMGQWNGTMVPPQVQAQGHGAQRGRGAAVGGSAARGGVVPRGGARGRGGGCG